MLRHTFDDLDFVSNLNEDIFVVLCRLFIRSCTTELDMVVAQLPGDFYIGIADQQ